MSAAMIVKTIKSQEKGGGSRENVSAPIGGSGGRVTTKWYDTKRGCVSIEVFIILLLIGVLYACHFMAIRYMPPTPPLQYVNVTTPCGVYIGIQQHNMYTFKGIRYAVLKAGLANNESAQPVWGNAAWCNPHDVHKSLNFGKPCLQMLRTVAEDGFATDQEILYGCKDCLFSNIFVPSNILNINTSGTGVIVYVHGGEMRQGSGHQEDIVPLSAIAARFVQDMGVLLVTFNYRLILHQSQGPIKQAHDVLSGSGVADQIELLRWVNKMIPYFGGNKDNVTLLVHDHKDSLIHQIEEKAGGSLFTRAIVLSPIITETSDYPISTTSDRTATRELSRTNDHEQFGSNCSQETCEWKPRGSLESHSGDWFEASMCSPESQKSHKLLLASPDSELQYKNQNKIDTLILLPRQSLDYCVPPELRLGRMDLSTLNGLIKNLLCNKPGVQNCSHVAKLALDIYLEDNHDSCFYDKIWANILSDMHHLCPVLNRFCPTNKTECEKFVVILEKEDTMAYKPMANKNYYAFYASKRWDLISLFGMHEIYFREATDLDVKNTGQLNERLKQFLNNSTEVEKDNLMLQKLRNLRSNCKFWQKLLSEKH